jgi:peptidyl-prolyl cis-trans isomerase A (cyclophilin A)
MNPVSIAAAFAGTVLVSCAAARPVVPVEVPAAPATVNVAAPEKSQERQSSKAAVGEIREEVVAEGGTDPLGGRFGMDEVRRYFPGSLTATLSIRIEEPGKEPVQSEIQCRLFDEKAPNTVANFVGLAQGLRPFKEESGRWVKRAAYDGTPFHRVIRGFMIQGGDVTRKNGSGEPGYVIPDEIWAGGAHDRAGLLCMANRGPDTNGAQFFITDAAVPHLDGGYTIFGECGPVDAIHALAAAPTGGRDRPEAPITIAAIRVTGNTAN